MSDHREYPLQLRVKMTGYDTLRYAVVEVDTSLSLQIDATGFNAFLLSLRREEPTLTLDVRSLESREVVLADGSRQQRYKVAVNDLSESLQELVSRYGTPQNGGSHDTLRLYLSERGRKAFRPDIRPMKIEFSEGYGLYGEPRIEPEEVYIYGDIRLLGSIKELKTEQMTLSGVNTSGNYRVPLDGQWKELGDLYASVDSITLFLPVEQYVERQFTVPVTVLGADTTVNLKLYPDKVKLRVWVARRDLQSVSPDRFTVSANYGDVDVGSMRLGLTLTRFPEAARLRSISPEEVQYVIIK